MCLMGILEFLVNNSGYKFYPLILNLLKEEQASAKNLLQLALSRLSLSVAKSREEHCSLFSRLIAIIDQLSNLTLLSSLIIAMQIV